MKGRLGMVAGALALAALACSRGGPAAGPGGGAGVCPLDPSAVDDDRAIPREASLGGCPDERIDAELAGAEASLAGAERRLAEFPTAVGTADELRLLEARTQAARERIATLRGERDARQSSRAAAGREVCVTVSDGGKVLDCLAGASAGACRSPEKAGTRKVFFAEGACHVFPRGSDYVGNAGGVCLSITRGDDKVSACASGSTLERCEGGAASPGYRYVFRETTCDAFRGGGVFRGVAASAGGDGDEAGGGRPAALALGFEERCALAGGRMQGTMCRCGRMNTVSEAIFTEELCRGMLRQAPFEGEGGADKTHADFRAACVGAKGTLRTGDAFAGGMACECGSTQLSLQVYQTYAERKEPEGFARQCRDAALGDADKSPCAEDEKRKATLNVTISDARHEKTPMIIDGRQTSATGMTRVFETPPICPDREYYYSLQLGGAPAKSVTVRGGRASSVSLP